MNRAELYKLRYRVIRNKTGNVQLARKLRSWSNERIYEEYGIKIPSKPRKVPELKVVSEKKKKRVQNEIIRYRLALSEGYTPKGAREVKRKGFKRLIKPNTNSILDEYFLGDRKDRKRQWAEWSKSNRKTMPTDVDVLAQKINRSEKDIQGNKFDLNAHYGYLVVYYAFILNKPIEEVRKDVVPNRQEAGQVNFYATLEAL
jgi:hypothetical protein